MFDRIELLKMIDELERALDKACKRLVEICEGCGTCEEIYCPLEDDNCNGECESMESWKEWCLKDE